MEFILNILSALINVVTIMLYLTIIIVIVKFYNLNKNYMEIKTKEVLPSDVDGNLVDNHFEDDYENNEDNESKEIVNYLTDQIQAFDERIESINDELIERYSQAEELHPDVHNIPHSSIDDVYEINKPEYAE